MIPNELAIDVLARTLWGESRGEGRTGMEAVAAVVMNRVRHPRWWGNDIISVCQAPYQFSCWNLNDPNNVKMRTVSAAGHPEFVTALDVAQRASCGLLSDPTQGADSYYAIGSPVPGWTLRATRTVDIGHHRFYRVELPAENGDPDAGTVRYVPPADADELNARELRRIMGTEPGV